MMRMRKMILVAIDTLAIVTIFKDWYSRNFVSNRMWIRMWFRKKWWLESLFPSLGQQRLWLDLEIVVGSNELNRTGFDLETREKGRDLIVREKEIEKGRGDLIVREKGRGERLREMKCVKGSYEWSEPDRTFTLSLSLSLLDDLSHENLENLDTTFSLSLSRYCNICRYENGRVRRRGWRKVWRERERGRRKENNGRERREKEEKVMKGRRWNILPPSSTDLLVQ